MIRIVAADGAVIHEHTDRRDVRRHADLGRVVDEVAHRRHVHDLRRPSRHRPRRRHLEVAARVRRLVPTDHRPTAARPHVGCARQPVPDRRHLPRDVRPHARVVAPRVPGRIGVLVRQLALPRGRAAHRSAGRRRLRRRRPSAAHRTARRWPTPTWPGAPAAANPAFGAQVTVDDYGKMLDMLLHDGMAERHAGAVVEGSARDGHEPGGGTTTRRATTPSASRRSPATASAAGPTWRTRPGRPRS